jgi:hypothetical protein
MNNLKIKVISVLMGLGHIRAAYPLRDISDEGILIYGSKRVTPPKEYKIWKKIKNTYYLLSRAGSIPILGKYILAPMLALQRIEPYYPVKDMSRPNLAVKYLHYMINKKGLCSALVQNAHTHETRMVHTFYATAIAMEIENHYPHNNYLLITDTDFNRVWVPPNPSASRIKYLAPCTQVKKRLLTYGVPEQNIYLTGFPLPKENIGSRENLDILKEDLWNRLLRLDPTDKFFSFHRQSVLHWLDKEKMPETRKDSFTLTFAVGGSGAQVEMIEVILKSLKQKIEDGKIKLQFSAGIQKKVFETITGYINSLGLQQYMGSRVSVIFDPDIYSYLDKFNLALRTTDVLWTKPSELSFYCALGIPILIAPPIGTHEELNKRWLQEIHAGIEPPGALEYTHEWLFDLRENGRLAEAAWDGFLKVRKLGTYHIEDLVKTGDFTQSFHPLEQ